MLQFALAALALTSSEPQGGAEPAQRFDLVCEGTMRQRAGETRPWPDGAEANWNLRLSVDLASSTWCDQAESCKFARLITPEIGSSVRLEQRSTYYDFEVARVDLADGKISWAYDHSFRTYTAEGACVRAPFTAMKSGGRASGRPWLPLKLERMSGGAMQFGKP